MNEKRKRLYKKKKTALKIEGFTRMSSNTFDTKKILFIVFGIMAFFIFVAVISSEASSEKIYIFSSRKYLEEKGVKNQNNYKEEEIEEVELAKSDEYYLGKGVISGENFYRFRVSKKGVQSYDIEVSDAQCAVNKVDDSNTAVPKVKVYRRTYENGTSVYFYSIFIRSLDIKDFGGE